MQKEKKVKDKIKLNKELEELRNKCDEYLNGWKRAQADYMNLKKQTEEDRSRWIKMANLNLIEELLPVYDNFKLATEHIPEEQRNQGWVVGIEHIKNQLRNFFTSQGVEERIVKEGDEFDVSVMEAVETIDNQQLTADKEESKDTETPSSAEAMAGEGNKEIEEENAKDTDKQVVKKQVRAGYRMKGEVIVPAKVIVQ